MRKWEGVLVIALGIIAMVYDWNCRPYHAIGFSLLLTPYLIWFGIMLLKEDKDNA